MIVEEIIEGRNLIRRYSDEGMLIRQDQTGILYGEAIDMINSVYTYTETDIPIENEEITAEEALDILLGE